MAYRFLRFVKKIDAAKNTEDLRRLIFRVRDEYGFANISYVTVKANGRTHREYLPFHIVTYDMKWCQRYEERQYYKVDPTIQQSFRSFKPIEWGSTRRATLLTRLFYEDADRHGVGINGMTLPLIGEHAASRALFSFSSNREESAWHRLKLLYARDLLYFGSVLHSKAMQLYRAQPGADALAPLIGEVDLKYLQALREGKVPKQIAADNKTTQKTVSVHLSRVREKLNASTNADAIVKAIELHLI